MMIEQIANIVDWVNTVLVITPVIFAIKGWRFSIPLTVYVVFALVAQVAMIVLNLNDINNQFIIYVFVVTEVSVLSYVLLDYNYKYGIVISLIVLITVSALFTAYEGLPALLVFVAGCILLPIASLRVKFELQRSYIPAKMNGMLYLAFGVFIYAVVEILFYSFINTEFMYYSITAYSIGSIFKHLSIARGFYCYYKRYKDISII